MPTLLRIERILSNRGYCTRGEARRFLREHEVCIGETKIEKSDQRVDASLVTIDNEPIDPPNLLLLMNKPLGVTCSHSEEGQLVYDLLPDRYRHRDPVLSTVGRLDKETSGALLLTDDGALLHRLTSPKKHVPRVYIAKLRDELTGREAETFASGKLKLDDDDRPLLPAELEAIDARTARLTLHEGRYHQVRRMFAAVGNFVVALHRESFGPIGVSDLQPGEWRPLSESEKAVL